MKRANNGPRALLFGRMTHLQPDTLAEIRSMLYALDGVRQDPRFHPEGDALFHSLQCFAHAREDTDDRTLWLAALVHDVGKALDGPTHDVEGADLLDGLVSPRVVWLVRHHLDLLRTPASTRKRLRGTTALADLERLRQYDLAGRNPRAVTETVEQSIARLTHALTDTMAHRLSADGDLPGLPTHLLDNPFTLDTHQHEEDTCT